MVETSDTQMSRLLRAEAICVYMYELSDIDEMCRILGSTCVEMVFITVHSLKVWIDGGGELIFEHGGFSPVTTDHTRGRQSGSKCHTRRYMAGREGS